MTPGQKLALALCLIAVVLLAALVLGIAFRRAAARAEEDAWLRRHHCHPDDEVGVEAALPSGYPADGSDDQPPPVGVR